MENRLKACVHQKYPDISRVKAFHQKGGADTLILHHKFLNVISYQNILFSGLFYCAVGLVNLKVISNCHISIALDFDGIVPDGKHLSLYGVLF